jgi:anti-sigma regulatory factor (Ser/Thr protein kinase)
MGAGVAAEQGAAGEGLRHEAFFYGSDDDFLAGTTAFIDEGLRAGEQLMVAVGAERIQSLRSVFGSAGTDEHASVRFIDVARLGRNPARIIPAWRDFVDRGVAGGYRVRGIGEPIWAGRSAAELVECQWHETLLNRAFDSGPEWRLMCPYDLAALDDDVIVEAFRSHPVLVTDNARRASQSYRDGTAGGFVDQPLPEPSQPPECLSFGLFELPRVREIVARHAARHGFARQAIDDAVLAVHEIATNSLRHGGGRGTLRAWAEDARLVCEVSDSGRIANPLVGRLRPAADQQGGRGVWLANQLCDLVQIRSGPGGTVVRLHMRIGAA